MFQAHSSADRLASGAHLRAAGISKSYPDRRVLTDVSFTASQGQRIALIGENGTGKSTLLRILAGVEAPDAGEVQRPGRVGLLWQELPFPLEWTIDEVVADGLAAPRAALQALEDATGALERGEPDAERRYSNALEAATRADVWSLDRRAEAVLQGVGLDLPGDRVVRQMSGGERARLSLAWLLLTRPTTLLLDEPTNHLDDAAVAFLGRALADWPGPVVLASHDRAFLDEVATGLVDLDPAPRPNDLVTQVAADGPTSAIGITRWTGSFTDYLAARVAERARWQKRFEAEQEELKRLEREVNAQQSVGHGASSLRSEARITKKFYADRNAKVVSQRVNDARSKLEELRESQVRKPPAELLFAGLSAAPRRPHGVPSVVAAVSEVSVTDRLAPVSWSIGRSEKWLVTGPNGSGKSTLLDVLTGRLAPTSGTVTVPRSVTVGLLLQDVELPQEDVVAEVHARHVGVQRAEEVPLTSFGLVHPRDLGRRVGELSVGQQRRLALALVLADPPDLLVLDEPTNHFSLALATALESEIPDYPGAVVVASHDRWLREHWSGERLELAPTGRIDS